MSDTREAREAGALILNNLKMFNEAVVLFEQTIHPEISEKIDERVESYLDGGWFGNAEIDADNCWLAPNEWNQSAQDEDPDAKARFYLTTYGNETSTDYLLSIWTGVSVKNAEFGFLFSIEYPYFGGKSSWRKYSSSLDGECIKNLLSLGFKDLGAGIFLLPINFDINDIAEAWDNEDYEKVLKPLDDAFKRLQQSVQWFSKILNAAPQQKANGNND